MVTAAVMLLRLPVQLGVRLLLPSPEGDPALFYAALILQETLLWGLPALLMQPWRSRRLIVSEKSFVMCIVALCLGALAQLALMALTPHWMAWVGAQPAAVLLPENEIQWVLAVLALAVIPALAEEAFFRGGLLTGLCEGMSSVSALLLSTVIFALMHGSLAGFPAHLGISLLCGLTMMVTGRLRVPVILHMCYNGAALLLRNVPAALVPVPPLGLILLAAALAMAAHVRWRRWYRHTPPGETALVCFILLGAAMLYLPEIL